MSCRDVLSRIRSEPVLRLCLAAPTGARQHVNVRLYSFVATSLMACARQLDLDLIYSTEDQLSAH